MSVLGRKPMSNTLHNYRSEFVHPVYATVRYGDIAGSAQARRRRRHQKAKEMARTAAPVKSENKNVGTKYMAKTKSRRYNKKKRGIIRKRIPRTLTPQTKLIKVRASQYVAHSTTGNTLSMTACQANSCDDPFGAAGAGQPLGYDQWKTLYKKAYVVGSKCVVEFHNQGTTSIMVGVTPMPFTQGNTALTGTDAYEYYKEYRGTKSRILTPDVDHCVIVSKVGVKKFYSIKDIRDNDDYQIDLINETPPSKLGWYHVWSQALNQTTSYATDIVINMEYIVLLTDPILPSRSVET